MALQLAIFAVVFVVATTDTHYGTQYADGYSYASAHNTPGYYARTQGVPVFAPTYYATSQAHQYFPSEAAVPACASNSSQLWCLQDSQYPAYEIQHSAEYHYYYLLTLYADLIDLDTAVYVERPKTLAQETYICSSKTSYVRPLRARNVDGKWRIIVNNIQVHNGNLTQTTRIEECLSPGKTCPKVPECYMSKCLQKSIYHRFLVYDQYDNYFPFAIETFKLPSSCACRLGAYKI
nr:neurotrophin 1-like [Procambarus clarkii]